MHIRKRAWGTALAMSMITGASLIGLPAQPAAAAVANKGDIDLVVKRSEDGGKVWSEPKIVLEGFGDTKGNPTPILIPETGRIVLLSVYQCVKSGECGRKPRVQTSDDNGVTWTPPREITQELGFPEVARECFAGF